MRKDRFEALVRRALHGLPPEIGRRLDNLAILVADWPTPRQLAQAGLSRRRDLLGLYEGIPLGGRGSGYTMVPPDRITIFRRPVELLCPTEDEMEEEVRRVVLHEIGHHLGFSEERLAELEGLDWEAS